MRSSITQLGSRCAAWRGLCTHPSRLGGAMKEQLAQIECGRETTQVPSTADSAESGGVVDACEGLWHCYCPEVRPATSRCCGGRADGRGRVSLVRLARSGITQQSTLPSGERRSGREGAAVRWGWPGRTALPGDWPAAAVAAAARRENGDRQQRVSVDASCASLKRAAGGLLRSSCSRT
jgi:hypothetical protein